MNFDESFFPRVEPLFQRAFEAMSQLEAGAISNPDEKRMVGHYWLRNSDLAPNLEIRDAILHTIAAIKAFASDVHGGVIKGANGPFESFLLIGIGGSALGPQFVADALGSSRDRMRPFFLDNTDPDGIDRVLRQVPDLGRTLCIVVSKSGGTKETRNGMLEAGKAYALGGLDFAKHAVAITGVGSSLDVEAESNRWLKRFPMWEWVGGRTSELSAVGLLPAALQGFDVDSLIEGARQCDAQTRRSRIEENPAGLLAAMWYVASQASPKDMVILPYKDRLLLFSRYLQQLIMESLGKELDLFGRKVETGIAVYGNKGSTDQHAYVQQLRDGLNNFYVTFIEVLEDRVGQSLEVEPGVTSGDYLFGFLQGTRAALSEKGRQSLTITVPRVDAFTIGVLIALYERAVGYFASFVRINPYHQPGVEAGKKAAAEVIELQGRLLQKLAQVRGQNLEVPDLAREVGTEDLELVFKICEHLSANPSRGVTRVSGKDRFAASYRMS